MIHEKENISIIDADTGNLEEEKEKDEGFEMDAFNKQINANANANAIADFAEEGQGAWLPSHIEQ